MPNYKLIYFPVRARAEPIRLMLHYAKVPFEDCRIAMEDWPKIKPTTPFGQLPVLEIDGVQVEQSMALVRYLAKQLGMDGKDAMESLQADVFACHLGDLFNQFGPYMKETDAAKKEAIMKNLQEQVFPPFFEKLEKRVAKNGFTAGKSILYSDILLAALLEGLMMKNVLSSDFATKHPNLMKVQETVYKNPNVKAYLDKRPHSDL